MTDFKTPRIKIVQGWPGHKVQCTVGDVLPYDEDKRHYVGKDISIPEGLLAVYPIHFKQLLWNEERTEEELAEVKYVKVLKDEHREERVPYYGRIKEWLGSSLGLIDNTCGGGSFVSYKNCEPCTEQDYNNALK